MLGQDALEGAQFPDSGTDAGLDAGSDAGSEEADGGADGGSDGGSDAGIDGGSETPDAGTEADAGHPTSSFSVNRHCFGDDVADGGSSGLRLRCAGLGTVASLPAPTTGPRLREAGFQTGLRVCKDVGGTQRCITGGISP